MTLPWRLLGQRPGVGSNCLQAAKNNIDRYRTVAQSADSGSRWPGFGSWLYSLLDCSLPGLSVSQSPRLQN